MVQDQRLRLVLSSRAGMTPAEIDALSDRDGWQWVYAHHRFKRPERLPALCFTGFKDEDRGPLELQAQTHFRVVYSVTKDVVALCTGPHPGPRKLQRASELGIPVLSGEQIYDLLEAGELPARQQTETPVKRKRGRPRKPPSEAPQGVPAPPTMTLADARRPEQHRSGFLNWIFGERQ